MLQYLGAKLTAGFNMCTIEETLKHFNSESVHFAWNKALERKSSDPEGAITVSRTIIESVCKHILDERLIDYNYSNIELPELYKLTAKELNLSPDQHNEPIFKQILGGCSGIVNGLGTLRNKFGDAHGKGRLPVKPKARHAELAVNLAGSMALFWFRRNIQANNVTNGYGETSPIYASYDRDKSGCCRPKVIVRILSGHWALSHLL